MKDYDLIISSQDTQATFTVQEKSKFQNIRLPILFVVLAYLGNLIAGLRQQLIDCKLEAIETSKYIQLIAVLATAFLVFCRQDRQDVMIVIKNVGVQLKSKSSWKFLPRHDKNIFIPSSNVIDLVIHEGFYGYGQVIFYMCILTKTTSSRSDEMIKVVFSELLPRKELLETVWKQSREILFGTSRRYIRRVPGQGLKLVE